MADAKLTALTAVSVPALDDLSYFVDVSDTTDDPAGSSRSVLMSRLMGLAGILPGGRLTLTTGTPVTTSDVTGATTIYYTPYVSDYVRLYDGTRVKEYAFTERSLALGTLTDDLPHDVWLYDSAGTLTMDKTAWTSGTARATALAWQTGLGWTKSGDATRFYLGTFRTETTTTTEDSAAKRFVWNACNRSSRPLLVTDSTSSWTYNSASWRQVRATTANRVEVVVGQAVSRIALRAWQIIGLTSGSLIDIGTAVGEDATTPMTECEGMQAQATSTSGAYFPVAWAEKTVPLGYHAYNWLEYGTTMISYGADGSIRKPGLSGSVEA